MSFDVARVRGLYPTLGAGIAQLEGPFGALQPETVVRAIITTLRAAPAQPGSRSARSRRTGAAAQAARNAVADVVGGEAQSVVLGGNLSTLMLQFAANFAAGWQLGDDIIISRLDHDDTIAPLIHAARAAGVAVKWAEVDLESGELPDWQYDRLITPHTKLVTLPLANASTGTVPDVRAIADRAHDAGALVMLDVGAALPHMPVDMVALGADLVGVSAQLFGGPTVAAIVAHPGVLHSMGRDRPGPIPQKFELGALPVELLDGLAAAVDHLAGLDEAATGSRRQRLSRSLTEAGNYERRVYAHLDQRLRAVVGVTVLGSAPNRVPVAAFTVKARSPDQVGDYLGRHGVSVWTGRSGQSQLMSALGVDELGGAVQIGIMPHTTHGEVDQLVDALTELVHG
jgi:cysteine desulfurase family protein (TIGR01976 family)